MSEPMAGTENQGEGGRSYWDELAAARKAKEDQATDAQRSSQELAAAVAETDRLGHLLARGTPTEPISEGYGGRILATDEFIARTLLPLARAVARFPGLAYLENECYLPHLGLGHKAARQLWNRAIQQIPESDLTREVGLARQALAPESPTTWLGMSHDGEYGMVEFFRRFERLGTHGYNAFRCEVIRAAFRPATQPAPTASAPTAVEVSPPVADGAHVPAPGDSTPISPPANAPRPWQSHKRGGMPLQGWDDICECLKVSSDRERQEKLKRLNEKTDGPIRWCGRTPEADPGELVAWIEDTNARAAAAKRERSDRAESVDELGNAHPADLAERGMHRINHPNKGNQAGA